MRLIVFLIAASSVTPSQCMMQKVKSFFHKEAKIKYDHLEKECGIDQAFIRAADANDTQQVALYLQKISFDNATLEEALYDAISEDYSETVKLLLPHYSGDFSGSFHWSASWSTNTALLSRTLANFVSPVNFAAKKSNILMLIRAGACPFAKKYSYSMNFEENFRLSCQCYQELQDEKIVKAIAEFREQDLQRKEQKTALILKTAVALKNCNLFNGATVLENLVHEYLFFIPYSLDANEPTTVHFRSEK